jgi:acyl-CoA dehydrogenase
MNFPELDQIDELRAHLRAWSERNPPFWQTHQEKLEDQATSLAHQLGEERFMSYVVPRSYGGIRETVQARDLCVIREELAHFGALADVMFGVQALASQPIVIGGTEEQKKKYLPLLARGENIGAFALTEPEAGSDVAAISLRVNKVSGGYCITGSKKFISNAGVAQVTLSLPPPTWTPRERESAPWSWRRIRSVLR